MFGISKDNKHLHYFTNYVLELWMQEMLQKCKYFYKSPWAGLHKKPISNTFNFTNKCTYEV